MRDSVIILLLLLVFRVSAQELPILSTTSLSDPDHRFDHSKKGNYAQDASNLRDQYVGTWEYNQNGILFQLRIFKQDQVLVKLEENGQILDYWYEDCIILKYKLIKNGTLLFNNLGDNSYDIKQSYGSKEDSGYMDGFILDQTRNVRGFFVMGRLPGNALPKLGFTLLTSNFTKLNPESYYDDGQPLFTIPTDGIEMVKIN